MDLHDCPICRSKESLKNRLTLFIHIDNWGIALLLGVMVFAFGRLIELDRNSTLLCASIAVLPSIFTLQLKIACAICKNIAGNIR